MHPKTAKAFAPAHISGIFIICTDTDPLLSGSMGAGICLESGAVTTVTPHDETIIRINGFDASAPTTLSAIKSLTDAPVLVETELNVPQGCGFGTSGAGALSAVLALNDALSLKLTLNELAEAAHTAEVINMTGLGDVAGQTFGGASIRKKPGMSASNIEKIPCSDETISWVSFGEISTRFVLSDEAKKSAINNAGKKRLRELMEKPTLPNLIIQSCKFAHEIELMSPKVKDAIEAVESAGGLASQAMLGNTVFAINDNSALSEFGKVHTSKISHAGAHLL
ncbi:MAG: pantoate kinase [Candidatus Methanoperedens sp.]|jgi:pantoate kinase|nr:pantoate kinase [Candidatus Methanoperedens sp.]PKL53892.1 MAG: GHMP kinase [Candidatus Methanoperedenaceae archaeon HGW-Methanoperedenaceae-1]